MTPVASKEVRLVARVSQDVQELVKNAAEMSGATLSQFIVDAVTAKATMVIEQARTIRLTLDGADRVFDALDNPPAPNRKLLAVARRMKEKNGFYYDNGAGSTG